MPRSKFFTGLRIIGLRWKESLLQRDDERGDWTELIDEEDTVEHDGRGAGNQSSYTKQLLCFLLLKSRDSYFRNQIVN